MNNPSRMVKCKIVRIVNGFIQFATYIGPYEKIPEGWSFQSVKPVKKLKGE